MISQNPEVVGNTKSQKVGFLYLREKKLIKGEGHTGEKRIIEYTMYNTTYTYVYG